MADVTKQQFDDLFRDVYCMDVIGATPLRVLRRARALERKRGPRLAGRIRLARLRLFLALAEMAS